MMKLSKRKILFRRSKLQWKKVIQWIAVVMLCSSLLWNAIATEITTDLEKKLMDTKETNKEKRARIAKEKLDRIVKAQEFYQNEIDKENSEYEKNAVKHPIISKKITSGLKNWNCINLIVFIVSTSLLAIDPVMIIYNAIINQNLGEYFDEAPVFNNKEMFFIVCLSHIIWWLFERNALVKFRNLSISKLFDYDGYLLQVQHLITGSILLWITRTAFMYWDCGNSVNSWLFWFKAFTPLLSILNYYYRRWKCINRPMTFIDVFTKWYLQIIVNFTKKNDND